ncbi:hypothetical protein [Catellatospora methionotrophica]|uniref:hypothetical protein n=1 Tax=Catellatospora methionotrophica TaxID=121620 RepID=UPI0033DA4B1C
MTGARVIPESYALNERDLRRAHDIGGAWLLEQAARWQLYSVVRGRAESAEEARALVEWYRAEVVTVVEYWTGVAQADAWPEHDAPEDFYASLQLIVRQETRHP